jgi:hypothetical protein
MSPGKAQRYHYAYEKNGSCCVLLAFEPHTGLRYVEVRARRTAVDAAAFMQHLLATHAPQVECLRLVQDNLHTHTPGAFYEVLPPEAACALSHRFEPHDTPLKGSWLTRAEIACAALAAQCLNRRIPQEDILRQAVLAWTANRNRHHKTVHWKCSQTDARRKFHRHYTNVQKLL